MPDVPQSKETVAILDVKHCAGCRDDFYNGHNDLGVKQCWMRTSAKLIPTLLIPMDMPPPYTSLKAATRPDCYHAERCVTVKPEALDSRGYRRR